MNHQSDGCWNSTLLAIQSRRTLNWWKKNCLLYKIDNLGFANKTHFWQIFYLLSIRFHSLFLSVDPYMRPYTSRFSSQQLREGVNGKKTFSFGHCPNHLNPPPSPQFGQLGPLFSEVKIQDLKVSLELKLLYILYNILYICNLKNS